MPIYKGFMVYNLPMSGTFYLEVQDGEEVDDFTIENFTANYMECLIFEEDYHADHSYDITCLEDEISADPLSGWDLWYINPITGEERERPKPEPTAVQLELF